MLRRCTRPARFPPTPLLREQVFHGVPSAPQHHCPLPRVWPTHRWSVHFPPPSSLIDGCCACMWWVVGAVAPLPACVAWTWTRSCGFPPRVLTPLSGTRTSRGATWFSVRLGVSDRSCSWERRPWHRRRGGSRPAPSRLCQRQEGAEPHRSESGAAESVHLPHSLTVEKRGASCPVPCLRLGPGLGWARPRHFPRLSRRPRRARNWPTARGQWPPHHQLC